MSAKRASREGLERPATMAGRPGSVQSTPLLTHSYRLYLKLHCKGNASQACSSERRRMSETSSRIDWVDYSKGICIILIVLTIKTKKMPPNLASARQLQQRFIEGLRRRTKIV